MAAEHFYVVIAEIPVTGDFDQQADIRQSLRTEVEALRSAVKAHGGTVSATIGRRVGKRGDKGVPPAADASADVGTNLAPRHHTAPAAGIADAAE